MAWDAGATERRRPAGSPWVSTARYKQCWRPASWTYMYIRETQGDKSNHMHVRWRSFMLLPILLHVYCAAPLVAGSLKVF